MPGLVPTWDKNGLAVQLGPPFGIHGQFVAISYTAKRPRTEPNARLDSCPRDNSGADNPEKVGGGQGDFAHGLGEAIAI